MTRLAKQRVLLVGASSGIGRAAARVFAAEGARLTLAARRIDRLAELTLTRVKDTSGCSTCQTATSLSRAALLTT